MVHHLILITQKIASLVLGERPTDGINDSTGSAEKKQY